MTLDTIDKSNQEDSISSSNSQDSNLMNFNRPSSSTNDSNDDYNSNDNLLNKEISKSETCTSDNLNKDDNETIVNNEQDDTLMDVESRDSVKDVGSSNVDKLNDNDTFDNDLEIKSPSKTTKKKENSKKRSKSTHKKPKEDKSSASPLIREPKLQINDKTLKKLKTKTDDLIFEDANSNSASSSPSKSKYTTANHTPIKTNSFPMPVVSNVLSRSLEAIFNSSNKKNGEFNSYSALGFNNRGPRVKRVCRKFDVFQGLPRAVFPSIPQKPAKSTTSKSMNNSPNKRNKNKKTTPNKSSASTSKSNSNSSLKADDDLESDSSYSSDDLDITEYIARNLKREMESSNS